MLLIPLAITALALSLVYFYLGDLRHMAKLYKQESKIEPSPMPHPSKLSGTYSFNLILSRPHETNLLERIKQSGSLNCGIGDGRRAGKTSMAQSLKHILANKRTLFHFLQIPTQYEEFQFLQTLFKSLTEKIEKELLELVDEKTRNIYHGRHAARNTVIFSHVGLMIITLTVFFGLLSTSGLNIQNYWNIVLSFSPFAVTVWLLFIAVPLFDPNMGIKKKLAKAGKKQGDKVRGIRLEELFDKNLKKKEALSFEITESQNASANLSGLGKLGLGWSQGTSKKARNQTLPDLVQEFREYLEKDVTQVFDKVVICFDELDKIPDPKEAREFLNKLKGIFSIPGVVYLATVSDEILKSYQMKNINNKDEVDSTFDVVVNIPPLELYECFAFLALRDVFSPEAPEKEKRIPTIREAALLSVLSGGNPRDLRRITQEFLLGEMGQNEQDVLIKKGEEFLDNILVSLSTLPGLSDHYKETRNIHLRELNNATDGFSIKADAIKALLEKTEEKEGPALEADNLLRRLYAQIRGLAALDKWIKEAKESDEGKLKTCLEEITKEIKENMDTRTILDDRRQIEIKNAIKKLDKKECLETLRECFFRLSDSPLECVERMRRFI